MGLLLKQDKGLAIFTKVDKCVIFIIVRGFLLR